jgi:phosphonate transport system permease protein
MMALTNRQRVAAAAANGFRIDTVKTAFEMFEEERIVLRRRRSVERLCLAGLLVVGFAISAHVGEMSLVTLSQGLSEAADYLARMMPTISLSAPAKDAANWYWGFKIWSAALVGTVLIAIASTTIGTIAAIPWSFVASRNLTPGFPRFVMRRLLEITRTIPALVYALAFVLAFGLGATAGVLAIAVHTTSSLGKLFSEVNETADVRPMEAVSAAGGGWVSLVRFAVLPQVLPTFISYVLLRLEKNIRSATVIGFVGAGGIGQELYVAIRSFQYQDVSAIALMIILLVALTDMACERLRRLVM